MLLLIFNLPKELLSQESGNSSLKALSDGKADLYEMPIGIKRCYCLDVTNIRKLGLNFVLDKLSLPTGTSLLLLFCTICYL